LSNFVDSFLRCLADRQVHITSIKELTDGKVSKTVKQRLKATVAKRCSRNL